MKTLKRITYTDNKNTEEDDLWHADNENTEEDDWQADNKNKLKMYGK